MQLHTPQRSSPQSSQIYKKVARNDRTAQATIVVGRPLPTESQIPSVSSSYGVKLTTEKKDATETWGKMGKELSGFRRGPIAKTHVRCSAGYVVTGCRAFSQRSVPRSPGFCYTSAKTNEAARHEILSGAAAATESSALNRASPPSRVLLFTVYMCTRYRYEKYMWKRRKITLFWRPRAGAVSASVNRPLDFCVHSYYPF